MGWTRLPAGEPKPMIVSAKFAGHLVVCRFARLASLATEKPGANCAAVHHSATSITDIA